MWYDPSHGAELGLVRGILTEHVMQSVSAEMFTGEQGQKLVDETLSRLDVVKTSKERGFRTMLVFGSPNRLRSES